MTRPGIEPTTSRSRSGRSNHYAIGIGKCEFVFKMFLNFSLCFVPRTLLGINLPNLHPIKWALSFNYSNPQYAIYLFICISMQFFSFSFDVSKLITNINTRPFHPIPWNFIGPLPVSHSDSEKKMYTSRCME